MKNVYYADYLKIDTILNSQNLESEKEGKKAHDEMLFIITHQAFELWFKQILYEVDAVCSTLSEIPLAESRLSFINRSLHRVLEIQKLLHNQIGVLETMTPLDFLDFRDYLYPASGFQSLQFRILELRLGLSFQDRKDHSIKFYLERLTPKDQEILLQEEKKPSLFPLVEQWLERFPFLEYRGHNFWQSYNQTVQKMLSKDEELIVNNSSLSDREKSFQLIEHQKTVQSFDKLFNHYDQLLESKERKLSQKATLAALFISLYRDHPLLQAPFQILSALVDMDEKLTSWRYRHALLANRMLGRKIGTGGSSGHQYLKSTADQHRIFEDFTNLSTFLIPRSHLPSLPEELNRALNFQ